MFEDLELKNVIKTYNRKKEVLSNISYTFKKGNIYTILGGIGSGRTTLMECMCEDITIDSGSIEKKEKSAVFLASKQCLLPMDITGYEYIRFLCMLEDRHEIKPVQYLDQVNMKNEDRLSLIRNMSFENKKRMQLAAFLVQQPHTILFDEPLDYCSEEFINDFIKVIENNKKDHIIIISTGLLETAEKIPGEIVALDNGELSYVPSDTLKLPELRSAIMKITGENENVNY